MAPRKDKHGPKRQRFSGQPGDGTGGANSFWLYGLHAARAALANPRRRIRKAVLTARGANEIGRLPDGVPAKRADAEDLARLLPPGAVHQGVALLCDPLPSLALADVAGAAGPERKIVAVLDQITDPHNEGAILRSACAFGVTAVVVQARHGAPESGVLAKAASGALDLVPRVVVVNIARALEELGRLGFWRIAMVGGAGIPLPEAARPGDLALVMGAEGAGLRRLVRERCDAEAEIPMSGPMESLNVSNAAAIAFYALGGTRDIP